LTMSKTHLRASKILRILNDGSSVYKYDNGCRNNLVLHKVDVSALWNKTKEETSPKKDMSYAEKYKKKFGLRKK